MASTFVQTVAVNQPWHAKLVRVVREFWYAGCL